MGNSSSTTPNQSTISNWEREERRTEREDKLSTLGNISTGLSSAADGASLLLGPTIGGGVGNLGKGYGQIGGALNTYSAFEADGGRFGINSTKNAAALAACSSVAEVAAMKGCEVGMRVGQPLGHIGMGAGCAIGGGIAGVAAYKGCEKGVGKAVDAFVNK